MSPLRRLRLARGLNQDAFESIGLDQAVISRIERSRRTRAEPDLPGATPEHAAKISKFLGHAVSEMEILFPGDYWMQEVDAAITTEQETEVARV